MVKALPRTAGNGGCKNLSGKTTEHEKENRDGITGNGTRDIEYFYCKERWFMKDIFAQ